MLARLCAFVLWALVAATAVFWGLRLLVRAPSAPASAVAVGDAGAVRVDLTRLLGAAPVADSPAPAALAEASSRFRLLGIMAPKSGGGGHEHGVALIAVDGKLPKAYRVGSVLDGNLVLQSVSLRSAAIGPAQGAPTATLELPPPQPAATGTLPGSAAAPVPAGQAGVVPPRNAAQAAPAQMAAPQFMPVPPGAALQANPPTLLQPRDQSALAQ